MTALKVTPFHQNLGRVPLPPNSLVCLAMPKRFVSGAGRARWVSSVVFAGLLVPLRHYPVCIGLEVIETVIDRDDGVLVIEDILEGFGSVPVSVQFSPVSQHMFMGFKAGAVRIYPDGGDTEAAAVFDFCVDMEEEVRGSGYLYHDRLCGAALVVGCLCTLCFCSCGGSFQCSVTARHTAGVTFLLFTNFVAQTTTVSCYISQSTLSDSTGQDVHDVINRGDKTWALYPEAPLPTHRIIHNYPVASFPLHAVFF